MKRMILVLAVLLALTVSAQAAQKLFVTVETSGNTWFLKGWTGGTTYNTWANDGDANAGLASFAILMQGVTTAIKVAPRGYNTEKEDTIGFKMGPTTAVVDANSFAEAFGGQDTLEPDWLIYNVGKAAGSAPDAIVWQFPVTLFRGIFDIATQTPMVRNVDQVTGLCTGSLANMFTAEGVLPPGLGNVYYRPIIPEPATMALLGLGAMALIRRRR